MLRPFVFIALLFSVPAAFATPAQILMIRHAEKPLDEENIHLSAKGQRRASALVPFILRYGKPAAIFAMKQRKSTSSVRAIETVVPLARETGLKIDDSFLRDEYYYAAEEILSNRKYDGKFVVICWEHDALNNFADELGVDDAPKWESVYDRAWVLKYKDDELVSFRDIPQKLLPGDSRE